jgi:hypothetical protein
MAKMTGFGLLLAITVVAAGHARASVVVNGDFEAGGVGWTTGYWGIGDFGRGKIGTQSAGTGATGSNAPDYALISQTLTTNPGTYYDLTFYVYADGLAGNTGAFPNEIKVRWDGNVVADYQNIPTTNPSSSNFFPGGPMTLFMVPGLLATTNSTVLSFGGRHDPAAIFIDNVAVDAAVTTTPEPAAMLVWSMLGLAFGGAGWKRLQKLLA